MPFSFFGKKDDSKAPASAPSGATPAAGDEADKPRFSSENAAKFFDHARTKHETTNYEYAAQLWLNGMRWDPGTMTGLEGFLKSAQAFNAEHKGFSKETLKQFDSTRTDVDRYLQAVLAWANSKFQDASLAVRAVEAAAKLGLAEPAHYLGTAALNMVRNDKKVKKDVLLKLKDAFTKVGAYDKAVEAGEAAVRLDPTDGKLSAEIRNLAAQATMSRGGYENAGQAGGFRANVRDAEKQRQLEERDRVVKSEDAMDRVLNEAAAEYERRPGDLPTIQVYIKRLMERGKDEDEQKARAIAERAYESTREFRFREIAGDINIRRRARKLAAFREEAHKDPENLQKREMLRQAREQFVRFEIAEFKLRVDAYPTEQRWKFELAKRAFELGDNDTAIPMFQQSQQDARFRIEALHMLAQAFQRIGYIDESIQAYRDALDAHKVATDETGMAMNYGLMTALQDKALAERDLAAITEADKIASALSLQQFNYRDVRQRRDVIKKLMTELRPGAQLS